MIYGGGTFDRHFAVPCHSPDAAYRAAFYLFIEEELIEGTRAQYLTTFFINKRAAPSAVQSADAAMKAAYFENISTTTMMLPSPSTLGKQKIKFIVRL